MASGKLNARSAATTKPGTYGDGAGLYLVVSPSGGRKWVYRFSWRGTVKMMGLGSAEVVSLAGARDLRDEARRVLVAGRNPIDARKEDKKAIPTFGQLADEFLEAKTPEWRHPVHVAQWARTLKVYCAPLRPKPVDAITTEDVLAVLKPIWLAKPETAARVRQRIELVLDAGKAKRFRSGENPASWRGHLQHLLPKRQRLSKGHHAAMSYQDMAGFIENLRKEDSISARALEFTILTAARSKEVFGARWDEVDFKNRVWIVPKDRMKAGREHRVALSAGAMSLLESLAAGNIGQFIFPSPRGDRPLSHIAMQKVLARLGVENATVHGMRSTFRDWAGQETSFPREICEQALAHRLGDAAELAYKRGDFLEKRRELMEAWSRWVRICVL